jgi:ABC-type transport system involved in multi-copper enzyme maturation permease subunit
METVQTQDLVPVRSRISWSAILGGAVVAMAIYLLLGALGLTLTDRVGSQELGMGAAVWAVATLLVSLFVGGFVTSQCTVGESKTESTIYGVIVWGVVFCGLCPYERLS